MTTEAVVFWLLIVMCVTVVLGFIVCLGILLVFMGRLAQDEFRRCGLDEK